MPDATPQPTARTRPLWELTKHQARDLKIAKNTLEMLAVYDSTGAFIGARDAIAGILDETYGNIPPNFGDVRSLSQQAKQDEEWTPDDLPHPTPGGEVTLDVVRKMIRDALAENKANAGQCVGESFFKERVEAIVCKVIGEFTGQTKPTDQIAACRLPAEALATGGGQ